MAVVTLKSEDGGETLLEDLVGPVREVRVETERIRGEGDAAVHEFRWLYRVAEFDPAGHLVRDAGQHHRGGLPDLMWLRQFDPEGRTLYAEQRTPAGVLENCIVGRWEGDVWVSEHRFYSADGSLCSTSVDCRHRDGRALEWRNEAGASVLSRGLYRYDASGRLSEVRWEQEGVLHERAVYEYHGPVEEHVVYAADGTPKERHRILRDEQDEVLEETRRDGEGGMCYQLARVEHDTAEPSAISECPVCSVQVADALAHVSGAARIATTHVFEQHRDHRTGALMRPIRTGSAQAFDPAGREVLLTYHDDGMRRILRHYGEGGRLLECTHETTSPQGSMTGSRQTFTYDALGREVEYVIASLDGTRHMRSTREYDGTGNWIRRETTWEPGPRAPGYVDAVYRAISYW